MAGSTYGKLFTITTWGESHGSALGVVIDGCPAGLPLTESDIQPFMDRRKPGQSSITTSRKEADSIRILSGVFEGKTTGTPLSLMVENTNQRSGDYSEIAASYRPGHADLNYDVKYGFRDYRGGGRSSGRETLSRVAAGAVAVKILNSLGISLCTYTSAIGPVSIDPEHFDMEEINNNPVYMPDSDAASNAVSYLETCIKNGNSAGGIIECRIKGMPQGIGDPVFEKLNANLGKAVLSIGAVKGFEIGDGFAVSKATGSTNNDPYRMGVDNKPVKQTNHSGGITGGMSDGCDIFFRVAVKPTPSISSLQHTVSTDKKDVDIKIKGRHDPVIVPRAVVVVESMAAITLVDSLLCGMGTRLSDVAEFYREK